MKIIHQKTKTLITRDNGRSSDAVSPNFIYGCLGGCMNSYCYVGRYNHDKVYVNENLVLVTPDFQNARNKVTEFVNFELLKSTKNKTEFNFKIENCKL